MPKNRQAKKAKPKSGLQPDGSFIMRDSTIEDHLRDHPKLRPDAAEIAYRVFREATGEAPKTPPPGERGPTTRKPSRLAARGRPG